jgi:Flp pilus assembly protein TadD
MDRALALDAASPWTQLALGYYFYQGRKEYEPAYAAFSKAHDGLPSSSDAIEAMGLVRRRQGRFDDAVAGLEKAIALDPQNALLHFTLGETLTIVRRYDDARRSLERAAELAPDPSSAYAVEARLAVLAGDVAGARALLARSAQGGQGSSEVRGSRFWIALDCRDYAAAQAFSVDIPEVSNAQFGFECRAAARGWVRKLQGDEAGARAELQKARTLLEGYVAAHPDEANVRGALARVLAGLGEGEAALRRRAPRSPCPRPRPTPGSGSGACSTSRWSRPGPAGRTTPPPIWQSCWRSRPIRSRSPCCAPRRCSTRCASIPASRAWSRPRDRRKIRPHGPVPLPVALGLW